MNTVSSSAVNSWIGEELRTKGVELTVTHKGRHAGLTQDYGATLGVFGANDPAGTLIAWRGWSISDRITGLTERLRLADLPVIRPKAPLAKQSGDLHAFREIDGRLGFYAGAQYAQADWLVLTALHADNRADPLVLKNGQYSWHTQFDHLGLRLRPTGPWELTAQALRGETIMGPTRCGCAARPGSCSPVMPGRVAV